MADRKEQAGAVLTIDLGAVRENYRLLRRRLSGAACGAAVKADAYGLGATEVARALVAEGCRHFFVAHLDEGIALRPFLPRTVEIFVLHGPLAGTERDFLAHGLIPVLNSSAQLAAWNRLAKASNRQLPAVIQVDTGMSRLGLSKAEVDALLDDTDAMKGLNLRYLMSHLACAERQDNPANSAQLDAFLALRNRFPACPASFANSSGIFLGPDYHFDLVRPGAALYGIAPVDGAINPMKPVVRLQARVIQVRTIADGVGVGYGLTYRASGTRRIATIATGYADGWLRSLSRRGHAYVGDARVPLVGTVSMDTCALDVTGAEVREGAWVDLICAAQPIDAVAADAGTIGYEILTSLGQRYHREYLHAEPGGIRADEQATSEFSV